MARKKKKTAADYAAKAEQQRSTQRRTSQPGDWLYDKRENKFWDTADLSLHEKDGVSASIPHAMWREVTEEPDPDAPPRRGRPRAPKRIEPWRDIMRIENDQTVEGSTWLPGAPMIIHDLYVDKDGFRNAPGRRFLNLYRFPEVGEPRKGASPDFWIDLVRKLFPGEAEHFFNYCAHMIQRPDEKCNHAVLLSGVQGIGKDSILAPLKFCVGAGNAKETDPDGMFSNFKPWLQAVMLTLNEVRPTRDDHQATSMYNILKPIIAAPPDVLVVNEKYRTEHYIPNLVRVFITTNNFFALYIPDDDRRLYVMHSILPQSWHIKENDPDYFVRYNKAARAGGYEAVYHWLKSRDISAFDAKAAPPPTGAHSSIKASWYDPDETIANALRQLGDPAVFFGGELLTVTFDGADELRGQMKSKKFIHRLRAAGYYPVEGRFAYKSNDYTWRPTAAYVKEHLINDRDEALRLLNERGQAEADRRAAIRGSNNVVPVRGF